MRKKHVPSYLQEVRPSQTYLLTRLRGEIQNMKELEEGDKGYPLYSTGITYWWFSPRLDIFMAMKSKAKPKPLKEESDWISIGVAKDGGLI